MSDDDASDQPAAPAAEITPTELPPTEPTPAAPTRRATEVAAALRGASAGVLLMAIGLFYLPGVLWGFFLGVFGIAIFAVQVATVVVAFFASKPIKQPEPRLFVRAVALAAAFTPFIPHAGVEWTMPFPPASFSILTGRSDLFGLITVGIFTALIFLSLHAIHRSRVRNRPTDDESAHAHASAAMPARAVGIVEDLVLGMLMLAIVVVVLGPLFFVIFG